MLPKRLRLYRLDTAYGLALSRQDKNVLFTSSHKGKETRPFVGVVIPRGEQWYCVPLSSPKPKHQHMHADRDFSKIVDRDGKLIGVLNFNSMIPVNERVLVDIDLRIKQGDSSADMAYKRLMQDQLRWCNNNRELIQRKVEKLYTIVTEQPESARGLVSRCCDFKKLEGILQQWT